jgi:SAM-dependent methyltransferase
MKNICLICNEEKNLKFVDNYKFQVEYDVNYFGKLKIYECENCNLSFVNPMPDSESLENFYKNIYRSVNRPHNHSYNDSEKSHLDDRFLNYILYLTSHLDFNKIKDIFDFGAGIGDLGYVLKKKYPHLNLHCNESDEYSLNILEKRGYKNFKNINEIDKNFDLIISLHCIEHLENLTPLFDLKKLLKPNGYFFIEVPNCPKKKYFIERPYDSPHLIFFTKPSWKKIAEKMLLKTIDLSYASYSLDYAFDAMKESKKKFGNWKPNTFNLREFLKKILPKFIIELRRTILKLRKTNNNDRSVHFIQNKEDSWCIRGLFINKS